MTLTVKPENVHLNLAITDDLISGTILSVTPSLGSYKIELDVSGVPVSSIIYDNSQALKIEQMIGSQVGVSFAPDSLVLI